METLRGTACPLMCVKPGQIGCNGLRSSSFTVFLLVPVKLHRCEHIVNESTTHYSLPVSNSPITWLFGETGVLLMLLLKVPAQNIYSAPALKDLLPGCNFCFSSADVKWRFWMLSSVLCWRIPSGVAQTFTTSRISSPLCNYMSHTGSLPSCRSQTLTHQKGQGDTCSPLSVSHRWPPDLKSKLFQCFPSQTKLDGQSYLSAQTFCDQIKELRPGGLKWHPRCSDLVCTCMCAFSFLMERQLHAALCNTSHHSSHVRRGRMQRKDWRPKCPKQGHKSKLPAKAAAKFFRPIWDPGTGGTDFVLVLVFHCLSQITASPSVHTSWPLLIATNVCQKMYISQSKSTTWKLRSFKQGFSLAKLF